MPLSVVYWAQPHDLEGLSVVVVVSMNMVDSTAYLTWLLDHVTPADGVVDLALSPKCFGPELSSSLGNCLDMLSTLRLLLMTHTVILTSCLHVLFPVFYLIRLLALLATIKVTVSHHLVLIISGKRLCDSAILARLLGRCIRHCYLLRLRLG
jgi:hypothetical protein